MWDRAVQGHWHMTQEEGHCEGKAITKSLNYINAQWSCEGKASPKIQGK